MNFTIMPQDGKVYFGDLERKLPIYGQSTEPFKETILQLKEDFPKCKFNTRKDLQVKLLAKFGRKWGQDIHEAYQKKHTKDR